MTHDWLILLLLAVIDVILNVINPFQRFVGEWMTTDMRFPLQDNTIPFWAVPIKSKDELLTFIIFWEVDSIIAILVPFIVILVYYIIRKDVYDFHQAILGLLYSVLITAVITDAIKDGVGRPRPDFFWRRFPDDKGVFEPLTRAIQCTGRLSVIKEGYKSFPVWAYLLESIS